MRHILLTLALFAAWVPAAPALTGDELLPVDRAFMISARTEGADQVLVSWRIADGYYLYQNKFRITTDTPGITLDTPTLPPALTQQDPIFGAVQTYRERVTLTVPVIRAANAPDTLTLNVRSQGCADLGVCYPPHNQQVLVALSPVADVPPPVAERAVQEMEQVIDSRTGSATDLPTAADATAAVPAAKSDPLAELGAIGGLGFDDDGILPVEQAYRFSAEVRDPNRLRLHWQIADGTYLYSDKFEVLLRGDGVALGSVDWPKPKIKSDTVRPDGSIGDVAVYLHELDIDVPLRRSNAAATTAELSVRYQGCAEIGICYPPVSQVLELAIPAAAAATATTPDPDPAATDKAGDGSGDDAAATAAEALATTTSGSTPPALAPAATTGDLADHDKIANLLQSANPLVLVGAFFLIGIGLAFTPCIFPMVPILSGIITGQGANITTHKAFVLSLTYVLSMAVVYALLGVIVGALGAEFNLQAQAQSPWILVPFAVLFAALAMSMFGFYELQLPSGLQSRLNAISSKQEGGTLLGVAVMGALSALIVGPCTGPAIAGVMLFIWKTGEVALGGFALLVMGLGMGVPLLAFGTSAGKLLPRAGSWMNAVKATFGVLMLAISILLLERLAPTYLPTSVPMLMWGTLLIVSAIYMGALHQLNIEASGWAKLWKGLGLVLLVYGVTFVIGVASGGRDLLQPLRGVLPGGGEAVATHLPFKRIKSIADLDRELAAARTAAQPVMLDFYADWCVYCKQMERETFPHPDVQQALANYVLLQADVTANDAEDRSLQQHVGIPAPPAMLFWGADGAERRRSRLLGFLGPADFASHVRAAGG